MLLRNSASRSWRNVVFMEITARLRVVLLRNSRALLRERLVVLGGLLSETPSTLRLM